MKVEEQLLLNDNYIDISQGTVIRVGTTTEIAIRNNSDSAFIFIVMQAKENSLEGNTLSDGYGIEKRKLELNINK
ncbi:hypothetical protein [Lacinutrix sp.]|uniref:hypothetical protein n=1 Tax=Lacinutrix sp. TaxID=1937692 RepID=UPI0025C0AD6C|nr:hypothetical protein [Lacinutrix sp.]